MARLPRLNLANIPQHVIQRGNNRGVCFFGDEDHAVYLMSVPKSRPASALNVSSSYL